MTLSVAGILAQVAYVIGFFCGIGIALIWRSDRR